MKFLLSSVTLIALLCIACNPPVVNPVSITLSTYSVTEQCLSTGNQEILVQVHNPANRIVEVEWKHLKDQTQTGWSYTVNNAAVDVGTLTIPANSSATVSLTITPNGDLGQGIGTVQFYDVVDPVATIQKCVYQLTAIRSYFRVVPATAMIGTVPMITPPGYDYMMWLVNDNNLPIDVQWARTNESYPSAWHIFIKTSEVCYPPNVMTDDIMIPANDSVPFRILFDHQSTVGSGRTIPNFWAKVDSLNSTKNQVVGHSVTP